MKYHAVDISQAALSITTRDKALNIKRAVGEYIAAAAAGKPRHLNDYTVNGIPVELDF